MKARFPRVAAGRKRSRGFTLVELLVVIAIIGVLVALLLPAIQFAREAARRLACTNNLSQLIVAVNHYEMSHGVYPPGTIDATGPVLNARAGYHHNWLVQILPYMEQQNAWDAVNKNQSIYHASNAPITKYRSNSIWWCPSQIYPGGTLSHYAACHNDAESPIDAKDHGVFFLNSRVRYDDITDGSSSTIFLGEKLADSWDFEWCSGTRGTIRNTGSPLNQLTVKNGGLPARVIRPYDGVAPQDSNSGTLRQIPGLDPDTPSEDPATIDASGVVPGSGGAAGGSVAAAKASLGSPLFVGGFASEHPNGVQFAFGDGSVRFLNQMVAPPILKQFGHRADGKLPVGDF